MTSLKLRQQQHHGHSASKGSSNNDNTGNRLSNNSRERSKIQMQPRSRSGITHKSIIVLAVLGITICVVEFVYIWVSMNKSSIATEVSPARPSHQVIVDERTTTTATAAATTATQLNNHTSYHISTATHHSHYHDIPNILIFTHHTNLLKKATKLLSDEDKVLRDNIRHTISLHPHATVRFLTDDDCIASIQVVLGNDTKLVGFFQNEQEGMFKADICRGAALYETGGLYFDADIRARFSMWDAIESLDTAFVVPRVHKASKHVGSFFQAFIGAIPQHEILLRYLELFVKYYQGNLVINKGPLGVLLLKKAHDETITKNNDTMSRSRKSPQSKKIALWQEVLYRKELFPDIPVPNWGTRRACRFVVVANPRSRPPFVVPFYSRVKGSRMCGGKDSNKKG